MSTSIRFAKRAFDKVCTIAEIGARVQPGGIHPLLPRVPEALPRRAVGLAEGSVAVDCGAGARSIRRADDGAQVVSMQPALGGRGGAFVGHQRLIHTRAVHEALHQRTAMVVLGHQGHPVVQQVGRSGIDHALAHASFRVVGQRGTGSRLRRGLQPVVLVVAVAPGAVARQVAVGVMADGGASGRRVLVQAIGAVAARAVGHVARHAGPLVQVVAPAVRGDLPRLVSGVAVGLVLRRAGEVVRQAR